MINLDKGEKIKYVARRYALAYSIEIILLVVAGALPYFAYLYNQLYWLDSFFGVSGPPVFFLHLSLYTLWLLVIWVLFFIAWSDYYLDAWIITDGRIIDVEQIGIFKRKVNTYRLDKITNMNVTRSGLTNIFNYGNLEIHFENAQNKLIMAEIYFPEKIKEIIVAEQQDLLQRIARGLGGN